MNWFFSYRDKKKTNCEVRNWPEDSFNYYYMKGVIYRDSCYRCKFANNNRPGDITLCDFWSWEKYHARDFEKDSTVSGVITSSSKGEEIINRLSEQVITIPTAFDNIARHNLALVKNTGDNPARDEIMEYWKMNGYGKLDQEFKKKYLLQRIKYLILRKYPFIRKIFGR